MEKKYNKKEVKWKIAKAEEHYTEKKAAFFLTALRLHEKERKDVEEGEREGEVRQGNMKQTKNRLEIIVMERVKKLGEGTKSTEAHSIL